eukprot:CAMPEP_0174713438 /NCGR_PEP_ID=MMETSP1094-20130205/14103_1 /TAXON_ID=156173 /ORGANISM="Chrysochromulina brevifilum, Strain UTEX LB 985" /LENGTH=436 /DNA_ID=CAMNT_0015912617 /DNA_START=149 /DNA_END=1459 /DNA_ORIENTATION=+
MVYSFAGTQKGRAFKIVPGYVDKPVPGASVVPEPTLTEWIQAGPFVLINTPNTVWAVIALAMYFVAPYDLSPGSPAAVSPLNAAFFAQRLPLWLFCWFAYTGFWHVTLYFLGWAERPFIAMREYKLDKVAHNLFWSTSGVIIWVAFENVFAYLWATGRLAYMSDAEAFASKWGIARFVAALALTPVWRDFHFFFAHRLLHFNALYAQVHSLHHRNTDIEPFSGLCMHPVEHLYYYACILPSLLFCTSPFALLWNGVHLILAPGASHSGYEDHWQADAYHYFHHRYFSCNYAGTNAAFLDVWFDSFVGTLNPTDQKGCKPRPDAKSTLRVIPTAEFLFYLLLSGGCLAAWAVEALHVAAGGEASVSSSSALLLAFTAGFGPVITAEALTALSRSSGGAPTSGPLKTLALLLIGNLFCSVPISWACYLALQPAAGVAA